MINYIITYSLLAIKKKVNMEGVLAIERNRSLFFLGLAACSLKFIMTLGSL